MQAVRDSEWEGREIARTRNSQEQVISLETPYYDICRIQVRAGHPVHCCVPASCAVMCVTGQSLHGVCVCRCLVICCHVTRIDDVAAVKLQLKVVLLPELRKLHAHRTENSSASTCLHPSTHPRAQTHPQTQAEDCDDEPPDTEATAHDYLLPFLPPGMALAGGAGSLTHEQALAVRERCLRALKDRLIERANIIQVAMDRSLGVYRQGNLCRSDSWGRLVRATLQL